MKLSLRWALIGASDIAATRLIPALRRGGDTVEVVQSTTPEWAAQFASTHGIARSTAAIGDVCSSPDIDAVYISSANHLHAEQAIAAATSGKHVLCEKPLALTMADGRKMIEAAADNEVVLATNHHLPGAGTHKALMKLVSSGSLGTPLAVRVAHAVLLPERLRGWRLDDPAGGGVILDITVHDLSAIQAILGRTATAATAIAVRQGQWSDGSDFTVPDAVMAVVQFGDVLVQLHDAFTVEHSPTSITVIGTEASVHGVDIMSQDPVGSLWRTVGKSTEEIQVSDRRDLYDAALDKFRLAVVWDGAPSVTGEAGLAALAGALAVKESAATGRVVAVEKIAGDGDIAGVPQRGRAISNPI